MLTIFIVLKMMIKLLFTLRCSGYGKKNKKAKFEDIEISDDECNNNSDLRPQ